MTNSKIDNFNILESHNLLKSHYKKSLFTLIKSAKRYYLGTWLIKLPFYAIFSESKAKKWRAKRKVRYENLQIAKKRFNLFPQIKSWVESSEFKEKYIGTNYPYPPLLNPNSIPYESIPADLAWELNLPLPPKYKFALIMASFTGHTSIVKSLQKCGVTIQDHIFDIHNQYTLYYDALKHNKCSVLGIYIYDLQSQKYYENNLKFILLSNNQSPLLWLVRDPLSRLKLAFLGAKNDITYHFDENSDLSLLENRFAYFDNIDVIISNAISPYSSFNYGNVYDFLCKWGFNDIEFLDFAELAPNKIFETCLKLSQKYDFPPPKNISDFDKKTYNSVYESFFFKPLHYNICQIDFVITIMLFYYFKGYKSDSIEVSKILSLNKDGFEKDIFIHAHESNLEKIKINKDYIQSKLQIFIDKLKEVLDYESKFYKTSENALINFLRTHSQQRKRLKNIFDKEVAFVRKLRPDIVESWKYYNEFEKITL